MTATTAPTAAGVLTLDTVSRELGCSLLHTKRLIARGALTATMMGSTPRVMASEVARYVSQGAKDFNAPQLGQHWFPDEERPLADKFRSDAPECAKAFLKTEGDIRALWNQAKQRNAEEARKQRMAMPLAAQLDVVLPWSEGLIAEMEKRRGRLITLTPRGHRERIATFQAWAECYLVSELRKEARRLIPIGAGQSLEGLYASREKYLALESGALEAIKSKAIVFSQSYNDGGPAGGAPILVSYHLKHAGILTNPARIAGLAF